LELWLVTDPDAEQFTCLLQRVISTGIPETTLIQAGVNGGKIRYWTMNLVPEFCHDGNVSGVLTCAADITVLKEYQREIEISRGQLRAQASRAQSLREEERKHIARELHDDLGQRLTALKLDLSRLILRFGQDNPALQRQVVEMETEMGATIQMVRDVATRLRPPVLDMGIASALEWLAQEFRRRTNIPCRLWIPQRRLDLDENQATVMFRIVQESLTNIMRHAFASEVFIYLWSERQTVKLEIKDNGVGFDAGNIHVTDSHGLIGIEERTLSLGGNVCIETAPGHGVKLVVCIPVTQTQTEEDHDQSTDGR
jgi:signal transduction histidine kinase